MTQCSIMTKNSINKNLYCYCSIYVTFTINYYEGYCLFPSLGYKPFMVAIQNQAVILNKILNSKQQQLQQQQQQQLLQLQLQQQQNISVQPHAPPSPVTSRSRKASSLQEVSSHNSSGHPSCVSHSSSTANETDKMARSLEISSEKVSSNLSDNIEKGSSGGRIENPSELLEESENETERSGCSIS